MQRIVLLIAIGISILSGCSSTNPTSPTTLKVRKNVTALTQDEKKDFTDAILKMKTITSPYDPRMNYYDQFVDWHLKAFYCLSHPTHGDYPAHMNPAFFPWHRVFLNLFENALREVSGKNITIPYWDWTVPSAFNVVFADDFLGGDGDKAQDYAVTTGPFRKGNFEIRIFDTDDIDSIFHDIDWNPNPVPYLVRGFTILGAQTVLLPTSAEIEQTLNIATYDSAPWNSSVDTAISFRNSLEGWRGTLGDTCEDGLMDVIPGPGRRSTQHNIVHVYVGGVMTLGNGNTIAGNMTQASSPNDPAFWVHHANIDRLWSEWMKRHGKTYVPVTEGRLGTNLNDVMPPWSFVPGGRNTPASVLDEEAVGYKYE